MSRYCNDSMPRVEIAAVIFLMLVLVFSLSKWKEKGETKFSGPDPVVIEHINGHVDFVYPVTGRIDLIEAGSQKLIALRITNLNKFSDKIIQSWFYRHILSIHMQRVPKDSNGNTLEIISAEFCLLG